MVITWPLILRQIISISRTHLQLPEGNSFPYCSACSNYRQHGASVCGSTLFLACDLTLFHNSFVDDNKEIHPFPAMQCERTMRIVRFFFITY